MADAADQKGANPEPQPQQPSYTCKYCTPVMTFPTALEANRHWNQFHKPKTTAKPAPVCPVCYRGYGYGKNLTKHVHSEHKDFMYDARTNTAKLIATQPPPVRHILRTPGTLPIRLPVPPPPPASMPYVVRQPLPAPSAPTIPHMLQALGQQLVQHMATPQVPQQIGQVVHPALTLAVPPGPSLPSASPMDQLPSHSGQANFAGVLPTQSNQEFSHFYTTPQPILGPNSASVTETGGVNPTNYQSAPTTVGLHQPIQQAEATSGNGVQHPPYYQGSLNGATAQHTSAPGSAVPPTRCNPPFKRPQQTEEEDILNKVMQESAILYHEAEIKRHNEMLDSFKRVKAKRDHDQ